MKSSTQLIKYIAISLAIALTIGIVLFVVTTITQFGNAFIKTETNEKYDEIKTNTNISILDIDVKAVNVFIKKGEKLKIETNNKYIQIEEKDNKTFIVEKKHNIFKHDDSDLIIYIPEDLTFDVIALESGAGKVSIETLKTKKLDFDLGAGKVEIVDLTVLTSAEINGGAGAIEINNSFINDLELELGVGKLELTSKLTGYNQINCGIGESNINLIGSQTDYKIKIDKGIGSAKIENDSIKDNTYQGNGDNIIDIDGGIGKIKIDFIPQI